MGMEKKNKIKTAAGIGATGRSVEERLAAASNPSLPFQCKPLRTCGNLEYCQNNIRRCPGLVRCGVNVVPCDLAAK